MNMPKLKVQDSQNMTSLFLGVTAGGLIGATAALLLAPKSGEDLRHDICDACQCVNEKAQELCQTANQYSENIQDTAAQYLKRIT